MLYLYFFVLYSIIGFIFESTVYKMSKSNHHSGMLYGPYTIIYGIGGTISFFINNLLNIIKNPYLNIFLCFIIFVIICTLIEYIGGNIIKILFNIDKWNYSNHKYHLGKYICLDYALIWGILALLFVKLFSNFFIQIFIIIPNFLIITFLIIIFIDFIISLYIKK